MRSPARPRIFGKFGDAVFSPDVEWTITGYGLVARTFHGMKDLINNAESGQQDGSANLGNAEEK